MKLRRGTFTAYEKRQETPPTKPKGSWAGADLVEEGRRLRGGMHSKKGITEMGRDNVRVVLGGRRVLRVSGGGARLLSGQDAFKRTDLHQRMT